MNLLQIDFEIGKRESEEEKHTEEVRCANSYEKERIIKHAKMIHYHILFELSKFFQRLGRLI